MSQVIEKKSFLEVASRTRQQLCNIMRYAVQQGLTENNPALHLEGGTASPVKITIPPCRWSEINFRNKIWTIPATRET